MRSQGALDADVDVGIGFHDVDMVGVGWHGHYVRYLEDNEKILQKLIQALEGGA